MGSEDEAEAGVDRAQSGARGRTIQVEVAHATPRKQVVLRLELAAGSTVAEAIERSGIRKLFPGLAIDPGAVGIFSRKVSLDQVLSEGDRVEIYRPLVADPKEVRRERAAAQADKGRPHKGQAGRTGR